uniref:Wsv285-like protein n=1 Tax=Trachysalambria curvirostris nimavirus TaxID=2984282 RepID=A0A9C7F0T7_9VIRU|nr:MAG: wsv285-like protein [Trachysalambria curvirostris nimavirus]
MFSPQGKQAAYFSHSASLASCDTNQELGALGIPGDTFKEVLGILRRRSGCLLLGEDSRVLHQIITDKTTQSSLSTILGPNRPNQAGSENKRFNARNNIKTKLEAEEAAIRRVFSILSSTRPSKDNPLAEENIVLPLDPWTAATEEQLEYVFREGVSFDVISGQDVLKGRFLNTEYTGSNPLLLKVKLNIRILQCMLLNFSWFGNRLYRLMRDLNVESTATSTTLISNQDVISNIWGDMLVKHEVRAEHVSDALSVLRKNYGTVYEQIIQGPRKPTYFVVEFDVVDNVIGLADDDVEHQGSACVEWRCFNAMKKNSGDGLQRFNVLLGTSNINRPFIELDDDTAEGAGNGDGGGASGCDDGDNNSAAEATVLSKSRGDIFASSAEMDSDSWIRNMMDKEEGAWGEPPQLLSSSESLKVERLRSGTSTATINQSSAVTLAAMAKGGESKGLVVSMIKYIDDSIKSKDKTYMCEDDGVFDEDQGDNYENHKDLYKVAICSNPANIYRVMCHLFVNLIMPRLRNPIRETKYESYPVAGASGRTKVVTAYGCEDMQYGTPLYARGKVRVDRRRICACRKLCEDSQWYDGGRKNKHKSPRADDRRHHNIHRSCAPDFRFFDILMSALKANRTENRKTAKKGYKCAHEPDDPKNNYSAKNDLLAMDQSAFDNLHKCFPSASLHHIYCPDILMVHRGDSYNIDLKNNNLRCIFEGIQSEDTTAAQKVDAKEALLDITKNKLKKGANIIEELKDTSLSLREYSCEVSRVVRSVNELTYTLCKTLYNVKDTATIAARVLQYTRQILPFIRVLLTFINNEEMETLYNEVDKANEEKATSKVFVLFKFLARFFLRNYNASVSAGINRRGYLANTATLTGYRFQLEGTLIKYHETIAAVSSCVAYADYYSYRNDGDTIESESATSNSLLNNLWAEDSKFLSKKDNEAAILALIGDGLLDDSDEDDDKSEKGGDIETDKDNEDGVDDAEINPPSRAGRSSGVIREESGSNSKYLKLDVADAKTERFKF